MIFLVKDDVIHNRTEFPWGTAIQFFMESMDRIICLARDYCGGFRIICRSYNIDNYFIYIPV